MNAKPKTYYISNIPAKADELKNIRKFVTSVCAHFPCDSQESHDIMLAIDEACQNIIRYAYHNSTRGIIDLNIQYIDAVIEIKIRDYAGKVNPSILAPITQEKLKPGGLGIQLIQKIMDSVKYLPIPKEKGNLLFLSKKINLFMNYTTQIEDTHTLVSFSGDIDLSNSPKIREILLDAVKKSERILVSLQKVSYIDSSGIATLVEALQESNKKGQDFALVCTSEAALRVLELSRLDKVFKMFNSVEEALQA